MEEITIDSDNAQILSNSLNTINQNIEILSENIEFKGKGGIHIRCLTCNQLVYISIKQLINKRIETLDCSNVDLNNFKSNTESLFNFLFVENNSDSLSSSSNGVDNVKIHWEKDDKNDTINKIENFDMFSLQLCCNCKHYLNKYH